MKEVIKLDSLLFSTLLGITANVGAAWMIRWARGWRWGGGRRRAAGSQSPNVSRPWESTDCTLSVAGKPCLSVVAASLEREGSDSAENWPHLS